MEKQPIDDKKKKKIYSIGKRIKIKAFMVFGFLKE